MDHFSPVELIPLVRSRIQQPFPRPAALYAAAHDLWMDEFRGHQALQAAGLFSAAKCAWQRRTAAFELCQIYLSAV